jgi:hypothetical protein
MWKGKLIAILEHTCYFHQMGYRTRLFWESDEEPQPNVEMIIVELWNKCRGLQKLDNISSWLRQISFRLLN